LDGSADSVAAESPADQSVAVTLWDTIGMYWVEIFDGDVKNLDELERRIATAAAAAVPPERAR
jgi:hypothetical protein